MTIPGAWCVLASVGAWLITSPQKGGSNPLSPHNFIAALAVVRQGSPHEWEAHTDVQRLVQAKAAGPNPAPLSIRHWSRRKPLSMAAGGNPGGLSGAIAQLAARLFWE